MVSDRVRKYNCDIENDSKEAGVTESGYGCVEAVTEFWNGLCAGRRMHMEQFEEKHYTREQADIHLSYCYGYDGYGIWVVEDRTMVYNTIWELDLEMYWRKNK